MFIMEDGKVSPAKVVAMPRSAIVINLNDLQQLAKEFIAQTSDNDDLIRKLSLSQFIQWLRNRQQKESDDGSRTNR